MYLPDRNHRTLIMGRNGAVGANHPLATQAGLDTLRAGGNAVDASVAISLALGVVEPGMSGLGGDGFYQVYTAGDATSRCYNATGAAPLAATPERFRAAGIAVRGPLSVSIPGLLGGLGAMHQAHGRLPWRQLCGPAIEHARDGFPVTHHYRHFAADARAVLAADARSRAVFLANLDIGTPPLAALIRQPDLARTLEEIAQDGADTFYRGRLAKRLAAGMREAGVLVDAPDLEACQPQLQDPIAIAYRGFRVTQTPPNSTGFTMLQMLKIVERFDLSALDPVRRIHVLVEAKKRAFLDRERYGTDPRFGDVPLDRLLSDAYADECAAAIDMARAADLTLAEPEAATGDTTYFCVVDADGNAVSGIQSLNSGFGSGRHRRRYRRPAEQPHGVLASGSGPRQPAGARQAGAAHDERADGVQGRQAVGGGGHARRGQSSAGKRSGADRDDGPGCRSADCARGAALDLQPAGPGRQLAA